MRRKRMGMLALWGAFLALFISACGGEEPAATSTPGPQAPAPDIEATVQARVHATVTAVVGAAVKPSPTPRDTVVTFVRQHNSISQAWNQFHADFDTWRQGLVACDASSVQVALRQFAGNFASVSQQASALPRSPIVREALDTLIKATEREEAALRLLRDSWKPEETAAFEKVATERAAAAALRNQVEDKLTELRRQTSATTRTQVLAFAEALGKIDADWDKFHQDYDAFRGEELTLALSEAVRRLNQLVARFSAIVVEVRGLPRTEALRPVSEILTNAVAKEEVALREARDDFSASAQSASTLVPATTPVSVSARTSPFKNLDTQIAEINKSRRQAALKLADVVRDTSEESQNAVAEFARQYSALASTWDAFHRQYDAWRRTEGGCDRAAAVDALGKFLARLSGITSNARNLQRATPLRPLSELFVEAAEREERALRTLRDGWRPFDAEVYKPFDSERAVAERLRHQVAAGVTDLLAQYNITQADIAR